MKLQGSLVSLCGLQQDAVVEELGFVALLRRLLLQLALELLALDGPDVRLPPPHSCGQPFKTMYQLIQSGFSLQPLVLECDV